MCARAPSCGSEGPGSSSGPMTGSRSELLLNGLVVCMASTLVSSASSILSLSALTRLLISPRGQSQEALVQSPYPQVSAQVNTKVSDVNKIVIIIRGRITYGASAPAYPHACTREQVRSPFSRRPFPDWSPCSEGESRMLLLALLGVIVINVNMLQFIIKLWDLDLNMFGLVIRVSQSSN